MRLVNSDELRSRYIKMVNDHFYIKNHEFAIISDVIKDINNIELIKSPILLEKLRKQGERDFYIEELEVHYKIRNKIDLSIVRQIFAVLGLFPVGFILQGSLQNPVPCTLFRPINNSNTKKHYIRVKLSYAYDLKSFKKTSKEEVDIPKAAKSCQKLKQFLDRFQKDSYFIDSDVELFLKEVIDFLHPEFNTSIIDQEVCNSGMRDSNSICEIRFPTLSLSRTLSMISKYKFDIDYKVNLPEGRKHPLLYNLANIFLKSTNNHLYQTKVEPDALLNIQLVQRGIALTPKGKSQYSKTLAEIFSEQNQYNKKIDNLQRSINRNFRKFPDSTSQLYQEGLAYFYFKLKPDMHLLNYKNWSKEDLSDLIHSNHIDVLPIMFDGLLDTQELKINQLDELVRAHKCAFEEKLECSIQDEHEYYLMLQHQSLQQCLAALNQVSSVRQNVNTTTAMI